METATAVETETATAVEMGTATPATAMGKTEAPIRIAFVDDHPTLLRGIAGLFDDASRYQIVGTALTSDAAHKLAESEKPDVMTVDLSMPGDVFGTIAAMAASQPSLRIIIFTAYDDVELAVRAIDAGAHAFVLKGRPADDLFEAIAHVRQGKFYVSPPFAEKLSAGLEKRAARDRQLRRNALSAREREIVDLLLRGLSNKEIGRELGLSEKTIKHYMTNLMTKLQVRNRLEVVVAVQAMSQEATAHQSPA